MLLLEWFKVLGKDELQGAQNRLLESVFPFLNSPDKFQQDVKYMSATTQQVRIDEESYINELNIQNFDPSAQSENVSNLLMIHGFGAGLGIYCRNYQGLTDLENTKINVLSLDLPGHSLSLNKHKMISDCEIAKLDKNFQSPVFDYTVQENKMENSDTSTKTLKSIELDKSMYSSGADILKKKVQDNSLLAKTYEDFYVESLEKYRIAKKLDKFHLLGHSFGGYLSLCYSLKYPEHVESLTLVSPVGVNRSYQSTSSLHKLIGKLHQEKSSIQSPIAKGSKLQNASVFPETEDRTSPFYISPASSYLVTNSKDNILKLSYLTSLWDKGVFPFGVLRGMGPLGLYMARRYTNRRYVYSDPPEELANVIGTSATLDVSIDPSSLNSSGKSEEEKQKELLLLSDYVVAMFWKKSSTEIAILRILTPVVTARDPIMEKLARAGFLKINDPDIDNKQLINNGKLPFKINWIYGDSDWMDVPSGVLTSDLLNAKQPGVSKLEILPKASHNLFLDNPNAFNYIVKQFLNWS